VKAISLAVALGSTVATAACGASSSSGSGSSAQSKTIVWYNQRPSGGPVDQAVTAVAKQFAKLHPGFKLTIETTAARPAYLQKIYTLAAANQPAAALRRGRDPFAQQLAREGKIVNIGQWLSREGLASTYKPLALKYDRFGDGQLYAVPLEFAMEFFFYNTSLFAKSGLKPPSSLGQLVSDCAPLRAKGIIPIAIDGQDGWPLLRYLAYYPFRMTGNKFVTELAQGKAKMTSPVGQAAANFIADLGKSNCFESGFSSTGYSDALNLFLSGKAGMINDGSWT